MSMTHLKTPKGIEHFKGTLSNAICEEYAPSTVRLPFAPCRFNYQPDYCIMRTLCEARHLLAPPGLTLFHDIFRIMLRYVHPEIAHKPKYREAFTAGRSLHDCASLYGPHCRQSFLLLISERFQEKYAR